MEKRNYFYHSIFTIITFLVLLTNVNAAESSISFYRAVGNEILTKCYTNSDGYIDDNCLNIINNSCSIWGPLGCGNRVCDSYGCYYLCGQQYPEVKGNTIPTRYKTVIEPQIPNDTGYNYNQLLNAKNNAIYIKNNSFSNNTTLYCLSPFSGDESTPSGVGCYECKANNNILKWKNNGDYDGDCASGYVKTNLSQSECHVKPTTTTKTTTTTKPTTTTVPIPVCEFNLDNNNPIYKINNKIVSEYEFITESKDCCLKVDPNYLKSSTATNYYNTYCKPYERKSCEYTVNSNNPIYKVNNKIVSLIDYLKAGCCDIDPNLINDNTTLNTYKNQCQASDTISLEHECGTKIKLGTNVDKVGDNEFTTTTCSNESYVDYTHSYIWQTPMTKVMEKVNNLENSEAYSDVITGLYNNSAISNYLDKSYLTLPLTKNGKTVTGVSAKNEYCMLYTSESDDIYFPGTAVATSGRFFVFNELNKEECLNSINPSNNCFRQPYVVGKIYATMHTNFTKWDKDYSNAIQAEKDAYSIYQNNKTEANKQLYDIAVLERRTLEKYKFECQNHNDLENLWTYNFNPTINFNYKQKVYGGTERTEEIKETVSMDVSNESVKYWPNVSTNVIVIPGSKIGKENIKVYTIEYGNIKEYRNIDKTEDYSIGYEQTLYYKPKQIAYSTIPTGEYILRNEEYQSDKIYMIENGLKVGYVYNVRLTTYSGAYTTSFEIDNVGHYGLNNISNIQNSLNKYKQDNNLKTIDSECVYCNQEGEFSRVCDVCPDPDNPELGPSYIYRTISLSDVTPNDRQNTNWSDEKGSSAEARIQSLSGDSVVSMLKNNNNNIKVSFLNENEKTDAKVKEIAQGNIYDDQSREYLEYEFTLTTKDMQIIKKNTERRDFDYASLTSCGAIGKVTEKDADADYCFICNADGKECESSFIDAFADSSTTALTRKNKWKYYINKEWKFGNWTTIVKDYTDLEGLEEGRYPDPLNQEAYLKKYYNWP